MCYLLNGAKTEVIPILLKKTHKAKARAMKLKGTLTGDNGARTSCKYDIL